MVQLGARCPDDPPALLAEPEAEVDVVESDDECLVEASDADEDLAPHEHARRGHAGDVLVDERTVVVAGDALLFPLFVGRDTSRPRMTPACWILSFG